MAYIFDKLSDCATDLKTFCEDNVREKWSSYLQKYHNLARGIEMCEVVGARRTAYWVSTTRVVVSPA